MKATLVALGVLTTVAFGCGDDGVIIIAVNVGVIRSDVFCRGDTGQFNMETQGGVVFVVVISSDTVILNTSGSPAACTDLRVGAPVRVRGPTQSTQIAAQSVTFG